MLKYKTRFFKYVIMDEVHFVCSSYTTLRNVMQAKINDVIFYNI